MTMEELLAENQALKAELAELKRLIFGAKRERFKSVTYPNQLSLFDESGNTPPTSVEAVESPTSTKQVVVTKPKPKRTVKRNQFPAHLERQTTVLLPEDFDEDKMVQIGVDTTETLAYKPAELFVIRKERPRFIEKGNEDAGVLQASVPPRLVEGGKVDESLIAQIIIEKILFHTPIYRFRKKLKQAGIDFIAENNLRNWFHKGASHLSILWNLLQKDLLEQPYLQADETPIPVLRKNKKGSTHRGYMWVLFNPKHNAVLFNYNASRAIQAALELILDFKGTLQTDGYVAYESIEKGRPDLQLIFCMAHARRKFVKAQESDPKRANFFLQKVQQLYQIERAAREKNHSDEKRYQLRQKDAVPILEELGQWLKIQKANKRILPKSPIGNAIEYTSKRWVGLSAYADDGQLEIDNNLIENCIRPIALGRKNYLFAGSDEAAQNLACLYSIVGTCERHGLNAQKYLTWLLKRIATHKVNQEAVNWLPHRLDAQRLKEFKA